MHFTYFSNILRANLIKCSNADPRFQNYQPTTMKKCGIMRLTNITPIPETPGVGNPFGQFGGVAIMGGIGSYGGVGPSQTPFSNSWEAFPPMGVSAEWSGAGMPSFSLITNRKLVMLPPRRKT